jgi:hypothetical protein
MSIRSSQPPCSIVFASVFHSFHPRVLFFMSMLYIMEIPDHCHTLSQYDRMATQVKLHDYLLTIPTNLLVTTKHYQPFPHPSPHYARRSLHPPCSLSRFPANHDLHILRSHLGITHILHHSMTTTHPQLPSSPVVIRATDKMFTRGPGPHVPVGDISLSRGCASLGRLLIASDLYHV